MANREAQNWMRALSNIAGIIQQNQARGQQQSQFGAQMGMQAKQIKQQEAQFKAKMALDTEKMKSHNEYTAALIKQTELGNKINELEMGSLAEAAEYKVASAPKTETASDVTKRGAEQITQGTEGLGLLNSVAQMVRNLPGAGQIAEAGPQTTPGLTEAQFIEREIAEGVDPAMLANLPKAEKTDYGNMKAAFDMNIIYGVPLSAEFAGIPGVVSSLKRGKEAYLLAQTNAEKASAIELATAEANLVYAQWKAKNPGFGRGSTAPSVPSDVKGKDILSWFIDEGIEPTDADLARANISREQWGARKKKGSAGGRMDEIMNAWDNQSSPSDIVSLMDTDAPVAGPPEMSFYDELGERYGIENIGDFSTGIRAALAENSVESVMAALVSEYNFSDADARAFLDKLAGSEG